MPRSLPKSLLARLPETNRRSNGSHRFLSLPRLKKISAATAASLALAFAAPSAWATLTITQSQLGNVFYSTETVSIPVAGTGTRIEWKITDFFGTVVKSGSANFASGSTVIQPNLGKLGYFEVSINEKDAAGLVIDSEKVSFAVLTAIDVSAMADSPFGAQTHMAGSHATDMLPVLARGGIAHVRDEQYWRYIQTTQPANLLQPGVYNYPSKYTGYMSALASNSIKPLITLDWSNPFYDYTDGEQTGPYTDTGRAGYAFYGSDLIRQYGGQVDCVEIWNEYNGTFLKGTAKNDRDLYYYLMLKRAYEQIKLDHPSTTVLAGATVPVAHGFLKAVFDQGAMPYLDAISVHPYRGEAEGVDLEISELRELIKQYNNGQEKPIWATEFSKNISSTYSLADQHDAAAYTVRIATQMLSQNVNRMYYYLSRDDSGFPYRGLISSGTGSLGKYAPHPVFVSYAVLIRQLYGWTSAGRMSGTRASTFVYKFTKGSSQKYVLWATAPTTVYLNTSAANLNETNLMGIGSTKSVTGGKFILQLGQYPTYITGSVSSVTEAPNPTLGESVADYSKTQGQNGWSYGYANLSSDAAYSTSNFVPMTWGIWQGDNYRWKGNGTYNFMTIASAHPSGSWAIRRWTSTAAATVNIEGYVHRPSAGGDGTRLRIFNNGAELLNELISPGEEFSYLIPNVAIASGAKIDIAITQVGNSTDDVTTCTARITKVGAQPVSLAQGSLSNYSGLSGTGAGATVSTDGKSVTLTGNVWRKHPYAYTVTPSTMLEFTVEAEDVGDLLGIGLDANDSYSDAKQNFRIAGATNNSNLLGVSQVYSVGDGAVTYVIPVGAYFGGAMSYLTFFRSDSSSPAGDAVFSNIRLYEAP